MAGDTIYLNNQKISFHDNNTYAFTVSFAKDKLNIDIGDNTHGGLKYSTNDYTLNGRIWEKYKIISFWQYNFSDFNIINIDFDPHNYDKINPFTFNEILNFIQKEFNKKYKKNIKFSNWLIDFPIDKKTKSKYKETHYKYYNTDYAILPIKDFKNQKIKINHKGNIDSRKIHLLNVEDKSKKLKEMGYKPKIKQFKEWEKPFENKRNKRTNKRNKRTNKRNKRTNKYIKLFEKIKFKSVEVCGYPNVEIIKDIKSIELFDLLKKDCGTFISELKQSSDNKLIYRSINTFDIDNSVRRSNGDNILTSVHKYKELELLKFKNIKNRVPKDTLSFAHDYLNKKFKKLFGWEVRNGIFTSLYKNISYGNETFIFFPINNYEYVYNTDIEDLTNELEDSYHFFENDINVDDDILYDFVISNINDFEDIWNYNFKDKMKYIDKNFNKILKLYNDYKEIFFDSIFSNYTNKNLSKLNYKNNIEISFQCDKYYLISKNYEKDIKKFIYGI